MTTHAEHLVEIYLEPIKGRNTPVAIPKFLSSTLHLNLISRPSHLTLLPPYNTTRIPSGPYFVDHNNGAMYRANRRYNDTVHVFTEPLVRDVKKNTYLALSINARSKSKTVAVPSKLYYSQGVGKTFSGVRLGVEDNLDVAGTKNNNDKPAPHMLPATKANTMAAVKKLEDAGAELVGKTSSSPSSGAASHRTPYNWMDLTLGLDKASYI